MISLSEFIALMIEDTDIDVILESRRRIIDTSISLGKPILIHLIKIVYFDPGQDLNHHLKDLNTWLEDIGDLTYNKGKRLKPNEYYRYLFGSRFPDKEVLEEFINKSINFDDYRHKRRIRTINETYNTLSHFYKEVSNDLSKGNIYKLATKYERILL